MENGSFQKCVTSRPEINTLNSLASDEGVGVEQGLIGGSVGVRTTVGTVRVVLLVRKSNYVSKVSSFLGFGPCCLQFCLLRY